jgi:glycosyltransferase involved in cell wall biosynthesis
LASDRFEVVVVDDCSTTTDIVALVEDLATKVPFRLRAARTPVNDGPAAARNIGWKIASAPFVAFLDDDCIPDPKWLEAGLEALTSQPRVGVIQGAHGLLRGLQPLLPARCAGGHRRLRRRDPLLRRRHGGRLAGD